MKKNLIDCPKCNNVGWIFYTDDKGVERCKFCSCWKQRKLLGKLEKVGLGKYFKKTFDDFKITAEWQKQMKYKALQYVANGFTENKWFILCGQYGSGKSLLASIMVKEILAKYEECSPMALIWSSFVEQYKLAFSTENRSKLVELSLLIDDMKECDLLYLDEILKTESPSTLNILFDIINYRYLNEKPTILTTEKNFEEIKSANQAIISRVFELTDGKFIINIIPDLNKNQRLKDYGL